jgi:HK97 family phage prohead protease
METKKALVHFDVKMEDETTNRGYFSGYGSIFGNVDLGGDVVEYGAFTKSLNAWKQDGQLPQMLWYHNNEEIIGEWTKMEEDEKGLYVEGKLWINGESKLEKAVQAYNVLKSNSVKGLSIGYKVKDKEVQENFDGGTIRKLKEIELFEVSIAPWAMNPQASVTGVKSMTDEEGNVLSKRDVERILRESGLSRKQSQAFIARGYEALERDAKGKVDSNESDSHSDVSDVLETLKNSFPNIRG